MQVSKRYSYLFITLSFLLSWATANIGTDSGKLEMAAIANLFGPPVCGLVTLVLFALLDRFFKNRRLLVVLLLALINLCCGIIIRLQSLDLIRRTAA